MEFIINERPGERCVIAQRSYGVGISYQYRDEGQWNTWQDQGAAFAWEQLNEVIAALTALRDTHQSNPEKMQKQETDK